MLRPNEKDLVEMERIKFEVDILVKLAYKYRDECDCVHALYLQEQYDLVCFQLTNIKDKFYLD